ncbi:MAG TPA: NFACT RNA binding domain-containing protein [Oscillospiraceae bacterium]|nr:NFACT RNA binding domain-containing protein [Oscillospiraceae bacterium]
MAYDGLTMACVQQELKHSLIGARIEKIYQPSNREIVLHLRTREAALMLLCSADPQLARVHLTTAKPANPAVAPAFCMLMRKHLTGARLLDIEQDQLERVLTFVFRSYDQFGDNTKKRLVCEVMGKHSNIILTMPNEQEIPQVLGSIKTVDETMSRLRVVMPGEIYFPPPAQDKLNLFDFTEEELTAALLQAENKAADNALVQAVGGLGRELAREIIRRAAANEPAHPLAMVRPLTIELQRLAAAFKNGKLTPCLRKLEDQKPEFSLLAPTSAQQIELTFYATVNEALDAYYTAVVQELQTNEVRQQLLHTINKHLTRSEKKQYLQKNELQEMEGADKYRIWGEMLTASLHQLRSGMKEAHVINYYAENIEKLKIPLDPSLSPQANAQRYFKRYRKLSDGKKYLRQRLKATYSQLNYLESLLVAAQNADLPALLEIREEMESDGLIRSRSHKKRVTAPPSQPLHFLSPDGIEVLVGKNNRQNDQLTMRLAASADVWLHVKDVPGSHVIIRHAEPPTSTLLFAAALAAHYSKAAASANVPVDYTQVRHVKKPRGAKPGMVIYDHHNTVYVTPSAGHKQ